MGQFLATGLVIEMTVSKKELDAGKISIDELFEGMKFKLNFNLDIYELTEKEDYLIFKLKDTIFKNELFPFLEVFLPKMYGKDSSVEDVLSKLKSTSNDKWMEIAQKKSLHYFQIDKYGEYETLYFEKDFNPRIEINSKSILLSLEGKIIMEEYGNQFNFYKYCMVQTFKEFSLATALRVYITG